MGQAHARIVFYILYYGCVYICTCVHSYTLCGVGVWAWACGCGVGVRACVGQYVPVTCYHAHCCQGGDDTVVVINQIHFEIELAKSI